MNRYEALRYIAIQDVNVSNFQSKIDIFTMKLIHVETYRKPCVLQFLDLLYNTINYQHYYTTVISVYCYNRIINLFWPSKD